LTPAPVPKKVDSSYSSCLGTLWKKLTPAPARELWKFTLRLLFPLRKLEGNDYFAS